MLGQVPAAFIPSPASWELLGFPPPAANESGLVFPRALFWGGDVNRIKEAGRAALQGEDACECLPQESTCLAFLAAAGSALHPQR